MDEKNSDEPVAAGVKPQTGPERGLQRHGRGPCIPSFHIWALTLTAAGGGGNRQEKFEAKQADGKCTRIWGSTITGIEQRSPIIRVLR